MLKRVFLLFVFFFFLSQLFPENTDELRGMWISDPTSLDWETVIHDLKKGGFNNIYVNFASAGAAFYKSSFLPEKKLSDSFNNLIKHAHKNNIMVHAKILCFYMYFASPQQNKKMIRAGRVLLSRKGRRHMQGSFPWLDPNMAENRELIKSLVREIILKFDVDGIQLDYVRFFEELKLPAYIKRKRMAVLNSFVEDIGKTIRESGKNTIYSACIFYNLIRAKNEMAQDWETWLDKNIFSYLVPMNYTVKTRQLKEWLGEQTALNTGKTRICSGLGAYMPKMTKRILFDQIAAVRQSDCNGFVIFSYTGDFVKKMLPEFERDWKLKRRLGTEDF